MGRKFLAARAELVNKLSSIAKGRKVTLYGLVNEILEQAIRADDLGDNLPEIIDNHFFIKMAKQSGFMPIPETIWYSILKQTYEDKNDDSLNHIFYSVGLWQGKHFRTVFADNTIQQLGNALQTILWNTSSLNLAKNGEEVTLKCTEPRFTDPHTRFLSTMFEGIIHSFGYTTVAKDVSRGIISLTFRKNKG